MPDVTGFAHVALTVTDLDRSKSWYSEILDWQTLFDGEEEGTRFSVGLLGGTNVIVGLRNHVSGTGDRFDPGVTGLDHVAFGAPSRAALEEWQAWFKEKDVVHSDIIDAPYGHVLNFKDPDNIALEIFAMPGG